LYFYVVKKSSFLFIYTVRGQFISVRKMTKLNAKDRYGIACIGRVLGLLPSHAQQPRTPQPPPALTDPPPENPDDAEQLKDESFFETSFVPQVGQVGASSPLPSFRTEKSVLHLLHLYS